jgi:hypothetical protein
MRPEISDGATRIAAVGSNDDRRVVHGHYDDTHKEPPAATCAEVRHTPARIARNSPPEREYRFASAAVETLVECRRQQAGATS